MDPERQEGLEGGKEELESLLKAFLPLLTSKPIYTVCPCYSQLHPLAGAWQTGKSSNGDMGN